MKTLHQQIYRILVFLTGLLLASWVQAATYSVTYFDQNNNIVGTGAAFVGIGQTICIPTRPPGDCSAPVGDPRRIDTMNITTPFNINAALFGEPVLSQEETLAWLGDDKSPAGTGSYNRGGEFIQEVPIFLGSIRGDINLIVIFGIDAASLETSISGMWSQFAGPRKTSGRFEGVATPIPAAVWLFASGLGLLGAFRRKMAVKA